MTILLVSLLVECFIIKRSSHWREKPHKSDELTWIYGAYKAGHLNGLNGDISVHPVKDAGMCSQKA